MGQIFYSCVYDIETKTCCVNDADKFHANCYAHSGEVLAPLGIEDFGSGFSRFTESI